jgi:hypothetical protein
VQPGEGQFALSGPDWLVDTVLADVCAVLAGKAGGRKGRAQGKGGAVSAEGVDAVGALLRKALGGGSVHLG